MLKRIYDGCLQHFEDDTCTNEFILGSLILTTIVGIVFSTMIFILS